MNDHRSTSQGTYSLPSTTFRQGGDLRGLDPSKYVDLGTCVNRYGPPSSVQAALAAVDPSELCAHPYDTEQLFLNEYSEYLLSSPEHLVAGRGVTEFIWTLARVLPSHGPVVLTPDYTDIIEAFPHHLPHAPGVVETVESRARRIATAMATYPMVILSNPNNPLGLYVPTDELAAICRSHSDSILIVDESYLDFTEDFNKSVSNSGLTNLVVLRSPTKLFGIAGTRTGALWTRNEQLLAVVKAQRVSWPISFLDSVVARAALSSCAWADERRSALLSQCLQMELALGKVGDVIAGTPAHFRFFVSDQPQRLHDYMFDAGFLVRAFPASERGRIGGLRIATPIGDEMAAFKTALARFQP